MQAGSKQRSHSSPGPSGVQRGSRPPRKTEKAGERASHLSARKKEKPQVIVAQDFIHLCTEKTKTDFIFFTIFLLALTYEIFLSLFPSFTSLR